MAGQGEEVQSPCLPDMLHFGAGRKAGWVRKSLEVAEGDQDKTGHRPRERRAVSQRRGFRFAAPLRGGTEGQGRQEP